MAKELKKEDVKKHNTAKSTWIIIDNAVYDVTKFLTEHPGGPETILERAGSNATQAFEDVGHSDQARELLAKFKIGQLPPAEKCDPAIESCCKTRKIKKVHKSVLNKIGDDDVSCTTKSCLRIPKNKSPDKPWRTFDDEEGSDRSRDPKKKKKKRTPRKRGPPCGSSKWKWALLLLAGAIVVGYVVRRNMA